jgi:hypothetical protein
MCVIVATRPQRMTFDELEDCLVALTGDALVEDTFNGNEYVGGPEVAHSLLGFEE